MDNNIEMVTLLRRIADGIEAGIIRPGNQFYTFQCDDWITLDGKFWIVKNSDSKEESPKWGS